MRMNEGIHYYRYYCVIFLLSRTHSLTHSDSSLIYLKEINRKMRNFFMRMAMMLMMMKRMNVMREKKKIDVEGNILYIFIHIQFMLFVVKATAAVKMKR